MPPRRDPDGAIQMRLRALAVAAGLVPGALIDEWHGRADALEWAGTPAPESERLALMHIEGRLA
jgi:hypothetical protein